MLAVYLYDVQPGLLAFNFSCSLYIFLCLHVDETSNYVPLDLVCHLFKIKPQNSITN